jgi:hypothetical protein
VAEAHCYWTWALRLGNPGTALERCQDFSPVTAQHFGEHRQGKSEQGQGSKGCEHQRSFRVAAEHIRTGEVPKWPAIGSIRTMFYKCSITVKRDRSFYVLIWPKRLN